MRKGYTVTYQMRKKQRQQREIVIQYVLKFVGVVLLAFLLVRFVCFSFTIQGDSMSPTIERGEKHLVNRLIYQIKRPKAFSSQKILSAGLAADEITLKSKQYFVVGDNYNNSEDSRSASVGNIKRTNIIGKVGIKYWPW